MLFRYFQIVQYRKVKTILYSILQLKLFVRVFIRITGCICTPCTDTRNYIHTKFQMMTCTFLRVSFLRKLKKKEIDFMDCMLDFWHRTIREGLVLRCFCRSYCFRGPPKTIVNFCKTHSN